jgi:tetratricopeptide (TPR) repeat protein
MRSASKGRARPVPTNWHVAWIVFFAALACALVTFGPALHGNLIFDDFHLPFADPHAAQMPARFWIGGVRPLLMLTYWANFAFSGTDTFSYHLVNLLLHALAALLVYLILIRLGDLAGFRYNRWLSLFGAGIFLLHPLQTESVAYIAGRSEIVSGIFVLAGWLIFLRNFESRISIRVAIEILFCAAAAVLSKETGIVLVVILLATDFYWRTGTLGEQLRKRLSLYVPAVLGALCAAGLIVAQLRKSVTAGFAAGASPFEYLLTQCHAILIYLRLFFWPAGQNLDWGLPFYRSLQSGHAAVFAGLMAILAGLVVYLYGRARLASFGLLIFFITLAPTSSVVPLQDALAERRMYLPVLGLAIVLIAVLARFTRFETIARAAMAAVLLALAVVSYARSEAWSSDLGMWQDSLEKNPRNSRGHTWLAGAYMLRQDCGPAAKEYKAAADLEGFNAENGRNLAVAYDCGGQRAEAAATWRELAKVHPTAEAYNRIGFFEAMQNNVEGSLAAFETALRLDPANADAWAYRGTARMALRDTTRAKEDFDRALALDPANAVAEAGLAKLPKYR